MDWPVDDSQAQPEYDAGAGDEEHVQVEPASIQEPGFFTKSLTFLYARSGVVRSVADSVQDALWSLRCEYEAAQYSEEEQEGAYEDEDEDDWAWGTSEVVAIAVV